MVPRTVPPIARPKADPAPRTSPNEPRFPMAGRREDARTSTNEPSSGGPSPESRQTNPRDASNEPTMIGVGAISRLVRVIPHDPDHGVGAMVRRARGLSREPKIGMGGWARRVRVLPREPGSGGTVRRAEEPEAGGCEGAVSRRGEMAVAGLAGETGAVAASPQLLSKRPGSREESERVPRLGVGNPLRP